MGVVARLIKRRRALHHERESAHSMIARTTLRGDDKFVSGFIRAVKPIAAALPQQNQRGKNSHSLAGCAYRPQGPQYAIARPGLSVVR